MPKLSIITINYNNKAGLEETIKSVVSQTFKDYEYIIIDGGSNDGSTDVIEKYKDRITYWVSEPDDGIYNAMNKGTKVATGEYCQYLNSGDSLIHENVLKDIFSQNPTADVFSSNTIWLPSRKKVQAPEKITLAFFFDRNLDHQATFYKRDLFKDNSYDESLKIVGDYKLNLQIFLLRDCSYQKIDIYSVYYSEEGISSTQLALHFNERDKVITSLPLPKIVLNDYLTEKKRKSNDILYKRMYKMDYYIKNRYIRSLIAFFIGIITAIYHTIDKLYKRIMS